MPRGCAAMSRETFPTRRQIQTVHETLIGLDRTVCWVAMAATDTAIETGRIPEFSQGQMLKRVGHGRSVSKATISRAFRTLREMGLLERIKERHPAHEPDRWRFVFPAMEGEGVPPPARAGPQKIRPSPMDQAAPGRSEAASASPAGCQEAKTSSVDPDPPEQQRTKSLSPLLYPKQARCVNSETPGRKKTSAPCRRRGLRSHGG